MLGRLGTVIVVLTIGFAPASAMAAPQDTASTHAYLVSSYALLHEVVATWPTVEARIHKLDRKFHAECPLVGAGSPQSEEEQKLSYEVAGALWATGYGADAGLIRTYLKALKPLRWSNPAVNRGARKLATGLHEMTQLQVPNLCADVRTWSAGGFKAVSPTTQQYDRHVEAIEVKQIPRRLLTRYLSPGDRGLLDRTERLDTRFEELEFGKGQDDWLMLLDTLALNE
jgi:hypothetical protein